MKENYIPVEIKIIRISNEKAFQMAHQMAHQHPNSYQQYLVMYTF